MFFAVYETNTDKLIFWQSVAEITHGTTAAIAPGETLKVNWEYQRFEWEYADIDVKRITVEQYPHCYAIATNKKPGV